MSQPVTLLRAPEVVFPSDRVSAFVEQVRTEIDALVSHDNWADDVWHVGHVFVTKAQNRDTRTLAFYQHGVEIGLTRVVGQPLSPTFIDFSKAYCRWMHAAKPVVFENTNKRLIALRLIEAGYRHFDLEPVIENLTAAVLYRALTLAKVGVGTARLYQIAIAIQQVHRFCMERKFLIAPFQWKHGVRKPKDRTEELGERAKEWRENRLPSVEAFHALAHVFRNGEMPIDLLFSAVSAICISIPIRAHEVLQLREQCEVHASAISPETGEKVPSYGIRAWPGKGQAPQVKWVPTHMHTVVQEAVKRLRDMCAPGRAVAQWYEDNPHDLWLPPELAHVRRSGTLSDYEVSTLVGVDVDHVPDWLERKGVGRSATNRVRLDDLTQCLLGLLPRNFPRFNDSPEQTYSMTLVVIQDRQLHANFAVRPCLVTQVTIQQYNDWLHPHKTTNKRSVFDRWGFTQADGSTINITTHVFRHWLNTVAQFRGMSEVDIAKWSGREAAQNKAYNHVSPEEMLSQIREAIDNGSVLGPMFDAAKKQGVNMPVDRREFINAQIGAALTTDYGICVHDYSLLPCQSHGDCLGCSENVFTKGDAKHIEKVTKRLELAEAQLARAIEAIGDDAYGADRWVEQHMRSVDRLRKMLAIHADPDIVDGTIVNLPDGALDNEVSMAIRDRDALGVSIQQGQLELADDPDFDLGDMWDE